MEKGKEVYSFDCTPSLSPLTLVMWFGFPGQRRKKHRYYKPCDNLPKKSHLPRLLGFCSTFGGKVHCCEEGPPLMLLKQDCCLFPGTSDGGGYYLYSVEQSS